MSAASRYAKSLLELSIEQKQLTETRADMRLLSLVCIQNKDFELLLKSPVIKTDKKISIFNSIFDGKVSKLSFQFFTLLAQKKREDLIPEIATSFEEQYKLHFNITTVKIESAVKIDEETKKQVLAIVKKQTSGEIDLVEKTNSDLIGGFILTINDKQIDQSVKTKLAHLRKNFSENHYQPNLN
ncbi:MAG: ATP synthase F1 subunit delta [Bacteroidetes bacterium]|nr:ATP synthase F1 subunit delta [Bacteroidota bacterium]